MKSRLQDAIARFPGHCADCGATIARNAAIVYDTVAKRTMCKACGEHKRGQVEPAGLFEGQK